MLKDLGASETQFVLAAKRGLKDPDAKKYFEQLIANENFMYFKNMMVKKNIEIQRQANNLLNQNLAKNVGVNVNDVIQIQKQDKKYKEEMDRKEKEELEALINMSKALEEEKKRFDFDEEQEFQEALKLSQDLHNQHINDLEDDIQKALRLSAQDQLKKSVMTDDELKIAIHQSLQEKERSDRKLKANKESNSQPNKIVPEAKPELVKKEPEVITQQPQSKKPTKTDEPKQDEVHDKDMISLYNNNSVEGIINNYKLVKNNFKLNPILTKSTTNPIKHKILEPPIIEDVYIN